MLYIFLMMVSIIIAGFGIIAFRAGVKGDDLTSKRLGMTAMAIGVTLGMLFTAFASVTFISTQKMGVVTLFGKVISEKGLPPGAHFVGPLTGVTELTAAQILIDVEEGKDKDAAAVSMSRDKVGLRINVGFPIQLNPLYGPRVYASFGNWIDTLARPSALAAIREAAARFDWADAAVEKHDEFAKAMAEFFQKSLNDRLIAVGFTLEEAKSVFSTPDVQLRSILPPDRILQANSERQAAQIELERQAVQTQIAQEEAKRRAQEGVGISNLFAQLPSGFNAQDIALILGAVSAKTQADALMRSVEDGKVQTLVLPYSAGNNGLSVQTK